MRSWVIVLVLEIFFFNFVVYDSSISVCMYID